MKASDPMPQADTVAAASSSSLAASRRARCCPAQMLTRQLSTARVQSLRNLKGQDACAEEGECAAGARASDHKPWAEGCQVLLEGAAAAAERGCAAAPPDMVYNSST